MNQTEKLFSQSLDLLRQAQKGQAFPTYEHEMFRELAPFFGYGFLTALSDQSLDSGPHENSSLSSMEEERWRKDLGQCQLCPREWINSQTAVIHQLEKWPEKPAKPISVLFLADAPKNAEASARNPLGGESGELMLKMIAAMKLGENDFAISLLSRCLPKPEAPQVKMQEYCRAHLDRELSYLRPKVVVAMGAQAMLALLGEGIRLAESHGQFFEKKVQSAQSSWKGQVVPLFHPEYLLINPAMKKAAWTDLQKIMAYLKH